MKINAHVHQRAVGEPEFSVAVILESSGLLSSALSAARGLTENLGWGVRTYSSGDEVTAELEKEKISVVRCPALFGRSADCGETESDGAWLAALADNSDLFLIISDEKSGVIEKIITELNLKLPVLHLNKSLSVFEYDQHSGCYTERVYKEQGTDGVISIIKKLLR